MKLEELTQLLSSHAHKAFQIRLPDGAAVPQSFHVTEVGAVHKIFLDCGGTRRESRTCLLQVWVGQDDAHRIETGKMAAILAKARSLFPDAEVPVEIEYEDGVISQYPVTSYEIHGESVILTLSRKHTECLAPELCGLPSLGRLPALPGSNKSCGPRGCC